MLTWCPVCRNNYQQKQKSDSLILVELLMLSSALMSFHQSLKYCSRTQNTHYTITITMAIKCSGSRPSPGARLSRYLVHLSIAAMMMFKWLWDHFLWPGHLSSSTLLVVRSLQLIININFIFPPNYCPVCTVAHCTPCYATLVMVSGARWPMVTSTWLFAISNYQHDIYNNTFHLTINCRNHFL